MATEKITIQPTADQLPDDAHILTTQPDEGVESLRRVSLQKFKRLYETADNALREHVDTEIETLSGDITALENATESNTTNIERIENNVKWEYFSTTFEIGSLTTGGAETATTSRVRSGYITTENCTINADEGYRFAIHYYDTNAATHSSDSDYWLSGGGYTLKTEYPYFRYVVEKVPAATVQESEVETYGRCIRVDVRTKLTGTIDEIDGRVAALENADKLPDYWESYLDSRIPQINNAVYSTGNHGVAFAFFSDYHYVQSEFNYQGFTWLPKILKRIKQDCPVETFIYGGDILTKTDTRKEALAILEKFRKDYAFLDLKNVIGNHDTNPYGGETVTIDDLYSILARGMGMEKSVSLEPGLYWYHDSKPQKIRIVALNTGEAVFNRWVADTTQHQWLVNTLAGTPDGYTIVVIPHVFFGLSDGALSVSSIGENIKTLIDAYATRAAGTWNTINYDFTNAGGTIACILCGHTHNDGMIASDAGYPMIGTVCDAMWGSQQTIARGNAVKYSIGEHAFDVVCIDTTAKTINCVRVGSGSDREYSYGA